MEGAAILEDEDRGAFADKRCTASFSASRDGSLKDVERDESINGSTPSRRGVHRGPTTAEAPSRVVLERTEKVTLPGTWTEWNDAPASLPVISAASPVGARPGRSVRVRAAGAEHLGAGPGRPGVLPSARHRRTTSPAVVKMPPSPRRRPAGGGRWCAGPLRRGSPPRRRPAARRCGGEAVRPRSAILDDETAHEIVERSPGRPLGHDRQQHAVAAVAVATGAGAKTCGTPSSTAR